MTLWIWFWLITISFASPAELNQTRGTLPGRTGGGKEKDRFKIEKGVRSLARFAA
jgi:hypothetical protein